MVKNPPYNAGDTGSIPGQGTKIPHATGQLKPLHHNYGARTPQLESLHAADYRVHALWNLWTTTTELTCPGDCTPQLEKRKTRTLQLERSPRATMKSPRAATKTGHSQK